MNKYLIVGMVAILIIAGGWWYLNQSSASTTSETSQQMQTNTQTQQASNLMQPGETRPIGGATPQCVSGYSVEQSGNVWICVAIKPAPQGVTIDQSSLVSPVGNPVLSGQAGTITKGSDLYVSVYGTDGKVWGSGNADPILSNGHWSIKVGTPDISFRLAPGTYTVYVGDPRVPFATGVLKISQ